MSDRWFHQEWRQDLERRRSAMTSFGPHDLLKIFYNHEVLCEVVDDPKIHAFRREPWSPVFIADYRTFLRALLPGPDEPSVRFRVLTRTPRPRSAVPADITTEHRTMAWDADNNAEPPGQRLPSAAETLGVENDSSLHYSEAYLWLKYGQLPSHRYNFGFESKAVLAQAIADAMSIGYNRGLDAR